MILLDTHVLIWAIEGSEALGRRAGDRIDHDKNPVYSAITAWEIGMLVSKGRITLTTTPVILLARAGEGGVSEVAVTSAMGLDAGNMPDRIHGDPADRILIATARALHCPLLTADEKILAYAAGHVQAIDARQ